MSGAVVGPIPHASFNFRLSIDNLYLGSRASLPDSSVAGVDESQAEGGGGWPQFVEAEE